MKRRDMLISTGATLLMPSAVALSQFTPAEEKRGKTYYIDPVAGDDAADGMAPSRAWKTYASREFRGGDTVLFRRGSVFRGVLHTRNGADQAPVTYGAYGEGDKPVFLGSVPANEPEHWVQERPSVWRYTGTFPSEVCNVVLNNGESCGILRWRIKDLQQPGDWHYTGIGMSTERAAITGSVPTPRARAWGCGPTSGGSRGERPFCLELNPIGAKIVKAPEQYAWIFPSDNKVLVAFS